MISLYSVGNNSFDNNGDAVLVPISCEEEEQAGAGWELTMKHPLDPAGRWAMIQNGAIIKAPVHPRVIKNALSGLDADIYTVNADGTPIREGDSEPTQVSYTEWYAGGPWDVGSRVTCSYNSHKNYQCISYDGESGYINVPPYNNAAWWKPIPDYTGGATVLTELPAGTELIYLEDAEHSGWIKVMTLYNVTGYVKTSQVTYSRHQSAEQLPDRVITEQMFRIYHVEIDSNTQEVRINARHVSYDLAGNLMDTLELERVSPAMAIWQIQSAWMVPYRGTVATNLTGEANGTYTGSLTGKGGLAGFIDPGIGMVNYFHAQLHRDNWDIFLMKNDVTDRGIRIRYGTNMKGVTWARDTDREINRIVPVAKAADGSELYLPGKWVDSANIANRPVIRMKRLNVKGQVGKDDGSGTGTTWTEEALLEEMQTKAEEEFSVKHLDAQSVKLTVDFQLLGDTEEYRQFRGLEMICMYDRIAVQAPELGMNLQLQVSRIRYDSIRRRYLGIEVGDVFDYDGMTVSGYEIGDGAIYYEKISPAAIKRIISEIPT